MSEAYTIQIWDDVNGWDGPDHTMSRHEAWRAVRNVKKACVYRDNVCVYSRGLQTTYHVLMVKFADRFVPIFAHQDRKKVETFRLTWQSFESTIETQGIEKPNVNALLSDCDFWVSEISNRDYEC